MSTKPLTPPPAPSAPKLPGQPPAGMIPAEAALLTAWVTKHWGEYDSVAYNVRVGHGMDPGPGVPESARLGAMLNSQRRIDAVLFKGINPLIVEVKVRASLWAIGQLYGYRVLWMRDNPTSRQPSLFMVCGSIDPDTTYVLNTLGIAYEVVAP